jgi:PhoH-like ATPase
MKGGVCMRAVLDTNVLLDDPNIIDKYDDIILCSAILEELDGLKKNGETAFRARHAIKKIEQNLNKIKFVVKDIYDGFASGWNPDLRDNKIIMTAKENDAVIISNDINVRIKAESIGIKAESHMTDDIIYKGWKILTGDTKWINNLHTELEDNINTHKLLTNEYVELINTDFKENENEYRTEYRYDGTQLVDIKLPASKVIKGLNTQQRFALDLLYNKDIPIKVVVGSFGSGKTYLAIKMALHMAIEKEIYKDITLLRTPIPADGVEIGFLPGSKQEKINDYFKPFLQYIDNKKEQDYAGRLIREERIKMDVVSFLKGINIEDSFIIMDECEDLNMKLLKLVGTRMASKSCIVFTGDYKQAESRYKHDNGITQFIEKAKGNPLVGIVILEEDVRSEASKVFADI